MLTIEKVYTFHRFFIHLYVQNIFFQCFDTYLAVFHGFFCCHKILTGKTPVYLLIYCAYLPRSSIGPECHA